MENETILEEKARIRRQVLDALSSVDAQGAVTQSVVARELLRAQPQWKEAESVLMFAPMRGEIDLWPLVREALAEGRTVALPRFDRGTRRYVACEVRSSDTDVQVGHFGIREPADHCSGISLNRLDLILVPGIAFDLHGHRLGRGKGYYDQMLAGVRGTTCGVGFDQQIVEHLPVEPHDVDLNCILTPTRWVVCRREVLE